MNFTKGQMLNYIRENIEDTHVLPVCLLLSDDYFADKAGKIAEIRHFYSDSTNTKLIVRSSSIHEDCAGFSNAGRYRSILNVNNDFADLSSAIEKVYYSYGTSSNQEILIQPMLEGVRKSGVIFTADMDTFADYYTVNYYEGNDTEAVTSGRTNDLKTFIAYRYSDKQIKDPDMVQLIEICDKIESLLHESGLDIEFAITHEHKIHILQVRLIATGKKEIYKKSNLQIPLNRIYKKVQKLSKPHPFLLGKTTYFGVMPDWNPAEILGIRPRKLAISLYKELVTDNIWAHQRKNYGYRDLTNHPLMVSFCGIPYIDTRITFNSFIPQNLNDTIAEKLVNYYLERLAEYPVYHDKIEFEIVFSCYYFNISDKLNVLLNYGFNKNEIKRIEFSLLQLTNKIIHPKNGLYKEDISKIRKLEQSFETIVHSEISLVDKIYWLIEECKEYGTLPFAGVARAAFVAVQFLHSFVCEGFITTEEYDGYMSSLHTVNKMLKLDLKELQCDKLSKEDFISKYGHIRPGTYDIISLRYDENFGYYFPEETILNEDVSWDSIKTSQKQEAFHFSDITMYRIQKELSQNGLEVTATELMQFVKESIEGREYLKFIFTKSVSKILQLLEELGQKQGITREEMANLDILLVKQLYTDLYFGDIATILRDNISSNSKQYLFAKQIKLPSIILKPEDIYSYFLLMDEPNFVTQKLIAAEIVVNIDKGVNMEGKIILIQSADPGYDFLLSKHIGGLITQFGGANSHMAIRCAELGIPAVIGVGESKFKEWKRCKRLQINCQKRQVICIDDVGAE